MSNNTVKPDRYAPIGVFDSGVGGLTVAKEIMSQIPNERIVYFGDTARVPYGSKSQDTIIRFARQICRFLIGKGVKAIVIACNTASALALDAIAPEFDVPILGVVTPGARMAVETTRNKMIGVIGTESTINSDMYASVIGGYDPDAMVFGKACPLFCPLVEEGWLDDVVTYEVATRYLKGLQDAGVDTLIMGCTHYPLIRHTIGEVMGESVTLVNPAFETARELKHLLERDGMNNDGTATYEGMKHYFYVSDAAEKFKTFANSILPCGVHYTELIQIENY